MNQSQNKKEKLLYRIKAAKRNQTRSISHLEQLLQTMKNDWIKKDDAVEYVLENHYDEIREAVFEQEAEGRQE